ncbi:MULTISPECIES: hypothetical protein [Prochlorococcus]|uniref:Uncharacterized protein n=1 Tax=Prochlorococcus marinus (strain SARG / CCMP1375 / SS120) TaxID=167539 RepID=Q7VCC9_PROMA|nr:MULTISPECIES: hypothetical protein [Prochlorococcus]AAP99855.1 Predicted protein [Prochlorococcus marinus subsp. marinus str. CCMP1375]KGG11798.1 hypothetical protein EV04_0823 [Prochlorococcus marinus str. LG]KGG18788.1 hypothetical protein EV08_1274 [Prochlorococcus marinus str. SS2]KGG23674.1 hypothetical protein EV09_1299 [Prochlorococcus marinus str. SS35]KGG32090.1 hypothetical protein EV10_1204 [Prochlorococcus marinus str. SS51]
MKYKSLNKKFYTISLKKEFISKRIKIEDTPKDYIYILFRDSDSAIKVANNKECLNYYKREGYKSIGGKLGSKRELNLIKITLKEIINNNFLEDLTISRIKKQLNMLGFLDDSIRLNIKKKF